MKKRTKRLLATLLASVMILQQGSTVGVLATEETGELPAETIVTEAPAPETQAPEGQAPAPETQPSETQIQETQASETQMSGTEATETQAPETKAPETQAAEPATEANTPAPETAGAPENVTETPTEAGAQTSGTEETAGTQSETPDAPVVDAGTDVTVETVTETAAGTETETEAPKTDFIYEDARVKITATAQLEAMLPQDAQIHADYMQPGTPEYQTAAAALEAAYAGQNVVLDYVFYDIYFTAESAGEGRIEPEAGTVAVSIQFKQPELTPETEAAQAADEAAAAATTYDVMHVENGKAQEVKSNVQTTEDGSVASVGFTSDSFSPYAIVSSRTAAVRKMAAPNGSDEEYGIMPIVNGDLYDIKEFLDSVEFYKGDTRLDSTDNSVEIEPNVEYSLKLHFSEESSYGGRQFVMENDEETLVYTYDFPEGFPLTEKGYGETTFTIQSDDVAITGHYQVDSDGKLEITIRKSDNLEGWSKFIAARNVEMGFSFKFKYEGETENDNLQFNDSITKTVTVKEENGVTLEKTATYDKETGTVNYKVIIRSQGSNTDIKVTDTINGQNDYLIPNRDVKVYSNETATTPLDPQPDLSYSDSNRKFELTIPTMNSGDVYVITYSAKVDYTKINSEDVNYYNDNTVKAEPEGGKSDEKKATVDHISHVRVKKDHGELGDPDAQGNVEIPWTITINEDKLENLKERPLTVTDTLKDGLKYSGTGLTIKVTDGEGASAEKTFLWEELEIDKETATGWTIENIIEKLEDASVVFGEKANSSITITYSTVVNVRGHSGSETFTNEANFDGTKVEGKATVNGTGRVEFLDKEVVDSTNSETEITWKVTFTVDGTVEPCILTDELPKGYMVNPDNPSENWFEYDYLDRGSIEIENSCKDASEKEGYDLEEIKDEHNPDKIRGYNFKFYHYETVAGVEKKVYGLRKHGDISKHTIVITYKTKTNGDWLNRADDMAGRGQASYNHENKVTLAEKNDSISVTIRPKTLTKKSTLTDYQPTPGNYGETKDTVEIDGIVYPIFYYALIITGVSGGTATITDKFKADELKYYDGWAPQVLSGTQYNCYPRGGNIVVDASVSGQLTFTLSELPEADTDNPDTKWTHYMVIYSMIPASEDARKNLLEKKEFSNTANYAGHEDSATVSWDYNPLTKMLVMAPEYSSDKRTASFKIDYNPSKVKFLEGTDKPLIITDSMTNLRLLVDTLKILANGKELSVDEYSYDFNEKGELVITLPNGDGKHLEITYEAKVIGAIGTTVAYSNTVRVSGCDNEETVVGNVTLNTDGGGTFGNPEITLYKYMKGFLRHPLEGAEYRLEMKEGDSWQIAKKKGTEEPYIFKTGADGKITITDVILREETDIEFYTDEDYQLVEVKAPEGYTLDPNPILFRINGDGSTGEGAYLPKDTINVDNAKEIFHIVKKDAADSTTLLQGAEFTLYKDSTAETDIVGKAITDKNGIASFSDLEAGFYYLKETVAPEGYELQDPNPIYKIVIDKTGNVTSISGEGAIEIPSFGEAGGNYSGIITNSKSEEKGSLRITKTTSGGTTPDDTVFTVTNEAGDVVATKKYSEFKETGYFEVSDLPVGEYTVTESEAEVTNYTLTVTGNSTATVTKGTQAEITLNNEYAEDKGSLKVTKTTSGGTTPDDTVFTVTNEAGDTVATKKYSDFKITGSFAVNDLEPGIYTVTESGAEVAGYTLTVTGVNTAELVEDGTANVTIVNEYTQDKGSLKLTKLAIGADTTGKKFQFVVQNTDTGKYYNADGTTSDTEVVIELAAGETKTLSDILVGSYNVTEKRDGTAITNYTLSVSGEGIATVTKDGLAEVTITNTYTKGTGIVLYAKKVFDRTFGKDAFSFTLQEVDADGNPIGAPQTKGNDDGGLVTFDEIKYDAEGTYYYTISEVIPTGEDKDGAIVYDTTIYKVTVEAELKGGALVAMVDKATKDAPVVFTNKTTIVKVDKIDETGKKLSGAKLQITEVNADGSKVGSPVETWTTDGSTTHEIKGKLEVGKTYVLEETESPAGYAVADPVKFTIDKTGKVLVDGKEVTGNLIQMTDKKVIIEMHVNKTELGNRDKEVDGAKLTIYEKRADGTLVEVDSWTSKTGETHDFGPKLEVGKGYVLKEEIAPDGYAYVSDIEFSVNNDGTIKSSMTTTTGKKGETVYLVEDAPLKLEVNKKALGTGEELAGAKLELLDSTEKVLDSWISEAGRTHDFGKVLKAGGSYTLRESVAPNGYTVVTDMKFTVTKDGTVTGLDGIKTTDASGNTVYVVEDSLNAISIRKVDETGAAVSGAKLVIKDAADKIVESWTTDGTAHVLSGYGKGKYTLSEVEAPEGYQVSADIPFEVTGTEKAGTVIDLTMTDQRVPSSNNRSLRVTKHLKLDGISSDVGVHEAVYYVALFADEARTQRVSSVKQIVFKNSTTSSVLFNNLGLGTYYVGETDENGTKLVSKVVNDRLIFYPEYGAEGAFTFEGSTTEGVAEFTNVYMELPVGFYLSGRLTITKKLLVGGAEATSNDTYYARVFSDKALTTPACDVLPLPLGGNSSASIMVIDLPIGDTLDSSATYYVAETDKNGTPLDPAAVTEYEISIDKSEVVLDNNNWNQEVVITNDFASEEEYESEFESEYETEVDGTKTAPKTGDDTDYMRYLLLMALSAGTCAAAYGQKRRKKHARR